MNRNDMPKKYSILKHWAENLIKNHNKYWLDCFFDETIHDSDEKKYLTSICFACGTTATTTERCHILPICKGGSNNVDNLHLLCKECHLESELFTDLGGMYDNWFAFKNPTNSGSLLKRYNLAKLLT